MNVKTMLPTEEVEDLIHKLSDSVLNVAMEKVLILELPEVQVLAFFNSLFVDLISKHAVACDPEDPERYIGLFKKALSLQPNVDYRASMIVANRKGKVQHGEDCQCN